MTKIPKIEIKDMNKSISIAESCTGGFVSSCFTSQSGSSKYFKGSVVAYSQDVKIDFLDELSLDC